MTFWLILVKVLHFLKHIRGFMKNLYKLITYIRNRRYLLKRLDYFESRLVSKFSGLSFVTSCVSLIAAKITRLKLLQPAVQMQRFHV